MACNHEPHHTCDPRRRLLLQGLAGGALATMFPAGRLLAVEFTLPPRLPAGQSVYQVTGKAWVNGKRIDAGTVIGPNDTVKTAPGSRLVFAVGGHAMLLRGGVHLVMQGEEKGEDGQPLVNLLRLLSGALLSVSRHKGMKVYTPSASIGVRGTGVYLEAGPQKTYFCDCYGDVDVSANGEPSSVETIHSLHHDRPLYIFNEVQPIPGAGNTDHRERIMPARLPRPNHTDDELMMIEALVGRTPPFAEKG